MIKTDRLILRPFVETDLAEMIMMFQDPDFMAFSPYGALNSQDATTRFYQILEHYQQHGFGKMAMLCKNSAQIIGYCGFEMCEIEGQAQAELGFRLIKSQRRQGYVIEAATKLIEDMQHRNFKQVIAFSEQDNTPAHHLLTKLGFVRTNAAHFLNMDVVFFKKEL